MSWIDGVSQCWWLSSNCTVWWEAWSAIGTFLAAGIALFIAGRDQRTRSAERNVGGRLAFVSLWPSFHRAQARVGDLAFHLRNGIVPDQERRDELVVVIDTLEKDLAEISMVASKLDEVRAERVVGAVAMAGYVARQARRVAQPVPPGPPIHLWGSPLRQAWLKDCDLAINLLLEMASESEKAGNNVTGRKRPDYTKDY
jgi:hypothetical protein